MFPSIFWEPKVSLRWDNQDVFDCLFRTGYKSLLSGSPANKQLFEEHSTPTAASIGEQMTQL